jgi:hypothetical protein
MDIIRLKDEEIKRIQEGSIQRKERIFFCTKIRKEETQGKKDRRKNGKGRQKDEKKKGRK